MYISANITKNVYDRDRDRQRDIEIEFTYIKHIYIESSFWRGKTKGRTNKDRECQRENVSGRACNTNKD